MLDLVRPIYEGIDLSITDVAILGTMMVAWAAVVMLLWMRFSKKRKKGKRNLTNDI